MAGQLRLLSSRRSYEFRPDHLRLSVLTERQHVERIRDLFEFQVAQIGTPLATFGTPPVTIPPGLVFDYGVARMQGGDVPIRMLHVEQSRIVIDVVGPSQTIAPIFAAIEGMFSEVRAPDGTPAIGTPRVALDYSEVSIELSASLTRMFAPAVRRILGAALGPHDDERRLVAVPSFRLRYQPAGEGFLGVLNGPDHELYQLELRAGTKPSESIVFSAAPLESDAHIRLIGELAATLEGPGAQHG